MVSALVFLLVWGAGTGCHVSDYGLITDNNQTSAGGGPQEIRDTRGKAKLVFAQKWATLQADGTDEINTFVRQNADGAQTLSSHNNFSVAGDATFSDDLYCSPETEGCAVRKSFDKDPTDPEEDPYDRYTFKECPGARSICLSLATQRYYGECGRTSTLSLQDRLTLWNMGQIVAVGGREALYFQADRNSLSVTLANDEGLVTPLALSGELEGWVQTGGLEQGLVDASNPLIGMVVRSYARWVHEHATEETTISGCYRGICRQWTVAGNSQDLSGGDSVSEILQFAARF
ncbi:hypothetical protein ABI59_23415 [Acidobacteria bacterium Mor1]|nr:hypothetical protein ABI59_23415 [Acidobacteria bacterium Mor1]